jgi:hypothetical protein
LEQIAGNVQIEREKMIKKIVSGGQTGAGRAALDFALKYYIAHGGWINKGRIAEDGPLPEKYQLQEMPTENYSKRTEQNVIDSDGTLIVSHGELTGGSAYTRKMAMKHGRAWLHTDLNKLPTFQAAMIIENWISKNGIEILNVAGPRDSKDPAIYGLVTVILELVFTLSTVKDHQSEPSRDIMETDIPEAINQPETVDDAVNFLISMLSLKDKSAISKMSEERLNDLQFTFGLYIKNRLLYPRNDKLLESCRQDAMDKYLHWDQASTVIIKKLWEALRKSHKLRVVK